MIGIIIKRIFAISWIMFGLSMGSSLEICSGNSRLIPLNLINTIEKYEGDLISYTVTSGENNLIKQGFFDIQNINSIQTQNICLPFDTYTIHLHTSDDDKNNERIGLIICNTKFISVGEYGYFVNGKNGCIPRQTTEPSELQNINKPIRVIEYEKQILTKYIPIFSYNSVKFFSGKVSTNSASYTRSNPSFSSHQSNKFSSDIFSYTFSAPHGSYHSSAVSMSGLSVNNILTPTPTTTRSPMPVDTNNPTFAPISIITFSPTITYTLAPTISFTSAPTLIFTQTPTLLPTLINTHIPTILPTLVDTPIPTLTPTPTILQTHNPSTQSLPIAEFTTSLTLFVSSNESYDIQTKLAICSATTTILNIEPDNCNYQGTSFSQNSRRLLSITLSAVHTYTATSILTISVQTSNPGAFFSVASASLSSAASSGTFTTTLLNACQQLGVTGAITSASVIGAVASGLNIIAPPTIHPTYYPSILSNSSNVSVTSKLKTEYIIIGSIMAIFGSFVILSGLYYYHYYRTDGSNKYKNIVIADNDANIVSEIDVVDSKTDVISAIDDIIDLSVDDSIIPLHVDSTIEIDDVPVDETEQLIVTVE